MKLFFKLLGRAIVAFILISIALTVYSVFGPGENPATPILKNYAIIKENSRSAYIIDTASDSEEPVLSSIIISYATSGSYIAAKQTAVPESEEVKPDYTSYCYWLIDTTNGQLLGPLANDEEFYSKCTELQLNFTEWVGA